jgi:catechol 2,3-dioxygenase-like lactoylglutathione lyase family enzyme
MVGKLMTVGIECTNLEASKQFYSQQLGLQQVAGGNGWAVLNGNGVSISMWQGQQANIVLGFSGGSLEEIRAALEAQGVATGEPQPHPGGRHLNVFDPDGHRVMIDVQ